VWAEALRCWRGPVLADLDGGLRQHPVAVGVAARRFSAAMAHADLAIGLGAHDAAVETLRPVAAAEPLHEGIHARLMLALASAGQRAAALTVFAELRSRLVDELGVEPALTVQQAHREVLGHETGPSGRPAVHPSGRGPRPAQLPADVAYFTGRTDELAELDGLLRTRDTAVVITAIAGTAAVGKTALAVHFAHRVAHWFSDGQMYVNLRGFEPSDTAMTPSEALRDLLTALGVPPQRIPPTPGAQVGLYRSLLANRRVLIVLDNARDAEQVRPLLPGASGCLALVTSRNQLASLVAVDGAHPLAVAPLAPDEAVELLAARLGRRRVDAEPDAARKIVAHCAGLPLALAIVAARAATRPGFQLVALAGELGDAPTALEGLRGAEPATDIHAVFSWSYRTLGTATARLFRLLGLHPGPDVTAAAAASLAGLPGATARRLLAELVDASLITEHLPGRYACHDLLRAYAAERARVVDSPAERDEALRRVVDHYLHTAHAAALAIDSHGDPIGLAPAVHGVTPEHIADDKRALAWFTIEYPVLLGAAGQAADAGLDDRAWRLGWTLARFLHREGRWHDQVAVQRTALDAAVRCSDLTGQAEAHRFVAAAHLGLGRIEDGHAHVRHYLDLANRLGNDVARAYAHICLAVVALMQNRAADAARYSRQALELFRATGQPAGQAYALNYLAESCIIAGDYRDAIVHCGQALVIQQERGDRWAQAGMWATLGRSHHHLGDHGAATTCFGKAVELFRQTGGRYYCAEALARLGDTHAAAGDPDAARDAWLQALEIFTELGIPEVNDIRAKLTAARQA
jgi:tetratricopeptide (TPR) repeat protein